MAGIAALMSKRKKRELTKRSDTELALSLHGEDGGHSEHHPYTSGLHRTDSQTPSKFKRASAGALKTEPKEWGNKFKQVSTPAKEMAVVTKDTTKLEDGSFETNPGPSYSAIYIGLVLVSIGMVITFVGLGEKGFKTLELKLIGPTLCAVGFICILVKIISCNCPGAFTFITKHFKRERKKPSLVDQSNSLEKGTVSNGHLKASSNKSTPQVLSPRVTLHSSKKTQRPRSTIPNYIEDSSDEDDFDPGRARAHTNHQSTYEHSNLQPTNSKKKEKPEILLTPKSLML